MGFQTCRMFYLYILSVCQTSKSSSHPIGWAVEGSLHMHNWPLARRDAPWCFATLLPKPRKHNFQPGNCSASLLALQLPKNLPVFFLLNMFCTARSARPALKVGIIFVFSYAEPITFHVAPQSSRSSDGDSGILQIRESVQLPASQERVLPPLQGNKKTFFFRHHFVLPQLFSRRFTC